MTELMALDLVEKGVVTDQIVLTVGYDIENLTDLVRQKAYKGEVTTDFYGRKVPKHAHGTANIGRHTASATTMKKAVVELFDKIVDKNLLVRRVNLSANHIIYKDEADSNKTYEQMDLFTSYEEIEKEKFAEERELKIQEATVNIRKKYGKNAVLKGINLQKGATTVDRNKQIGGHKA